MSAPSRRAIAAILGLAGFLAWVVVVVSVADLIGPVHWALEALYFLVVGTVWALPARWLLAWAYRPHPGPSGFTQPS